MSSRKLHRPRTIFMRAVTAHRMHGTTTAWVTLRSGSCITSRGPPRRGARGFSAEKGGRHHAFSSDEPIVSMIDISDAPQRGNLAAIPPDAPFPLRLGLVPFRRTLCRRADTISGQGWEYACTSQATLVSVTGRVVPRTHVNGGKSKAARPGLPGRGVAVNGRLPGSRERKAECWRRLSIID